MAYDPQVTVLYDAMKAEVEAASTAVFMCCGMTEIVQVMAHYQDMAEYPDDYDEGGMLCPNEVKSEEGLVLFSEGEPLDTEIKIRVFAERKLKLAQEYAIWRLGRLAEFKADKIAIIGGR